MTSEGTSALEDSSLSTIDCDVHIYPRDNDEFRQYLPDHLKDEPVLYPRGYWASPVGVHREDARPDDGGRPGSDPQTVIDQHLDGFGIDHAVLTGGGVNLGLSTVPNTHWAGEFMSAYNDWFIDTWLEADDRFLGSISVASQTPERAAAEIRRLGSHPQMVQVVTGSATRTPLGREVYWPIYEAAEEEGLPVTIHVGREGKGTANPPTGAGYPNSYFEWHVVLPANYIGQLVSMVTEGVFVEFPDLQFLMLEGGFGWLPHVMWRFDKDWKGLKDRAPWLTRPPSEYIKDHVRFGTQPIEEPPRREYLLDIFEMISAEETLVFSSDYPHWDGDSPAHGLPNLPDSLERAIFHENAAALYGL